MTMGDPVLEYMRVWECLPPPFGHDWVTLNMQTYILCFAYTKK